MSAVVAYLYHDAASAEAADPLLHSTLLVMASDRRPSCRNETPLVTLAQAEAMVAAERDRIRALVEAVRDANAAEAHGDYPFRVLTAQQERAWVELMDALNVRGNADPTARTGV